MSTITGKFFLARQGFTLNVDVSLPSIGVTALFGASGSGKTTLLRCIAGLERVDNGFLRVGNSIWQDQHHFLPVHQRAIGFVFQDSHLFPHLNVEKNLRYGLQRATQPRVTFSEIVELLGLASLLEHSATQLSGGQRQRVAIGRALLTSPELLLMDEPLASLDAQSKTDILPYLEKLSSSLNIPMIYVSHATDEVLRIAEHMLLLDKGELLAAGPVNQLLTRTSLPLAHLDDACAIVTGKVTAHDHHYHLTWIELNGGRVAVSKNYLAIGSNVRLRIMARDISLALSPAEQSSISNILRVHIDSIKPTADPAKVLVKLALGQESCLAQITARSVDLLKLKTGQMVYAHIKSVALMGQHLSATK